MFYFCCKTGSSVCGSRKRFKTRREIPEQRELTDAVAALVPQRAQAEHALLTARAVPFPGAALAQLLPTTQTRHTAASPRSLSVLPITTGNSKKDVSLYIFTCIYACINSAQTL